jgi:protein FAM32A
MSFTGGKLKLKGGDLPGIQKKKKKSSGSAPNATSLTLAVEEMGGESKDAEDQKKALHGYALTSPKEEEDRRTVAEKKYDEHQRKMEGERLRKLAQKSHRWGQNATWGVRAFSRSRPCRRKGEA